MSALEMADLIRNAPPGPWPSEWAKWDCTRDAFLLLIEEAIAKIPPFPEGRYQGRGIVISVNAKPGMSSGKHLPQGYFPGAWVLVRELRRLGCRLPIVFTHLGDLEWDYALTDLVRPLGVEVIDLRRCEKADPNPPRILAGWESKVYGILQSPFEQVLYLDADNLPLSDPSFLFDSTQFRFFGSVFWPDVPPYDRAEWLPECVWRNVGLTYRDEVDFETGQFLIDLRKCWRETWLTWWINQHSDYFYQFVFGDKSTFHLAWARLGTNWAIPQRGPGGNQASLFQHDFAGNVLFQHCTRNKPSLAGYPSPGHLLCPGECQKHLDELRSLWNGRLWTNTDPTESEVRLTRNLEGQIFVYERVGLDRRQIRLVQDGRIGRGLARMEVGWSVFHRNGDAPRLVLTSLEDVPTATLTQQPDGSWRGQWLEHERCEVTLTPIFH